MSLLAKLKSGNMDAVKTAILLLRKGAISKDIILMADEMYVQKCVENSGGSYVGADVEDNLYNKGVMVLFKIEGLKQAVSVVVKATPEVTVSGQWLAAELSDCISSLGNAYFQVHGIVTDNHSTNVTAIKNVSHGQCSNYILQCIQF